MTFDAGPKYKIPDDWFVYDAAGLLNQLLDAEGAIFALTRVPCRQGWLRPSLKDRIQAQVDGSCQLALRERGATDLQGTPGRVSQSQVARDTLNTARWILSLPPDAPIDETFVLEAHRRLTDAAEGGLIALRAKGEQSVFGRPARRGAKGGRECRASLSALFAAVSKTESIHPPLVRGIALHYHLLAMQPFREANSRTARAVESFAFRKMGLDESRFIPMSQFYAAEESAYYDAVDQARRAGHDLTPFLSFTLRGLTGQCSRLLEQVRQELADTVFRNTMQELFDRIRMGKRAALAARQLKILELLLENGPLSMREIYGRERSAYSRLKNPWKAFLRDASDLFELGAVTAVGGEEPGLAPRMEWPEEITPMKFLEHYTQTPRSGAAATALG